MKKAIVLLIAVTATFATFAQTGKMKTPMAKKTAATHAKYTCSMDKDVITDKPGKCPKCGMALTMVKPKAKAVVKPKAAMKMK